MLADNIPVILASVSAIAAAAFLYFRTLRSSNIKPFITHTTQKVELIEKIVVSHDTRIYRFALSHRNQPLGLPIGRHIRVSIPNYKGVESGKWNGRDDETAAVVERKYTPLTLDSTHKGHFDLLIKVYKPNEKFSDGGKVSQYLEGLKLKSKIDVSGPFGLVEYKGNGIFTHVRTELRMKHVGMIAGGTGITPMYQIIQAILNNPEDPTTISLIYANQSEDDILLRDELTSLQKEHSRFKVHFTVDRAPIDKPWAGSVGFVTAEMISKHLPAPSPETICLLCGPPPMLKYACHQNLDKLDWPRHNRLEF